MTPEEKKKLLREKLGIGDPLKPEDFDGPYLLPRSRRPVPIRVNPDGSALLSKATFEKMKALISTETGPDPQPPGLGFIELAELLELTHLIPDG